MQHESGDTYIRRLAAFIHLNERALAESIYSRPRRNTVPSNSTSTSNFFNPLSWLTSSSDDKSSSSSSSSSRPVILSIDIHHLFYTLMRLESLGINVGNLDTHFEYPSHSMNYLNSVMPTPQNTETQSILSWRSSFSAVSNLRLDNRWWLRPNALPDIDIELKYIYSCFTKLPAISICPPVSKLITELVNDPPLNNAVPLDAFKSLTSFECEGIDPRSLLGWGRLSQSLQSLKIRRSGLHDITELFTSIPIRDSSPQQPVEHNPHQSDQPLSQIPSHHIIPQPAPPTWSFLKYLSLADNGLATLPPELFSVLTSVTHLDLSSNLFVSIPSGLSALYNLFSLNLSDNLVDSVVGIYQNLGQVSSLNLAHNRIESLCGIERLLALETLDIRHNIIEESAEVGRLATLPFITNVWIAGNPFHDFEEEPRVNCFLYFFQESKDVKLDGLSPTVLERRRLPSPQSITAPTITSSSGVISPPVISVEHARIQLPTNEGEEEATTTVSVPPTSPRGSVVARKATRKTTRLVELSEPNSLGHRRERSAPAADVQAKTDNKTGRKAHSRVPTSIDEPIIASLMTTSETEDAEAYRRKIESLKAEMGDGWLKVFNQTGAK
ncbi:hypothetical protein BJ165DRAFT_1452754 [Panaeolus papilionaceus]|nr:hypothetical protein BJ165DRAFT_1452754 [Panaeolus papilionaceus]